MITPADLSIKTMAWDSEQHSLALGIPIIFSPRASLPKPSSKIAPYHPPKHQAVHTNAPPTIHLPTLSLLFHAGLLTTLHFATTDPTP